MGKSTGSPLGRGPTPVRNVQVRLAAPGIQRTLLITPPSSLSLSLSLTQQRTSEEVSPAYGIAHALLDTASSMYTKHIAGSLRHASCTARRPCCRSLPSSPEAPAMDTGTALCICVTTCWYQVTLKATENHIAISLDSHQIARQSFGGKPVIISDEPVITVTECHLIVAIGQRIP